MALITNLNEQGMESTLCSVNQPSDNRMVIVQFLASDNKVATVSARYEGEEKWVLESLRQSLSSLILDSAVWFESRLWTTACCATNRE